MAAPFDSTSRRARWLTTRGVGSYGCEICGRSSCSLRPEQLLRDTLSHSRHRQLTLARRHGAAAIEQHIV